MYTAERGSEIWPVPAPQILADAGARRGAALIPLQRGKGSANERRRPREFRFSAIVAFSGGDSFEKNKPTATSQSVVNEERRGVAIFRPSRLWPVGVLISPVVGDTIHVGAAIDSSP